jgi:hypothetical protein
VRQLPVPPRSRPRLPQGAPPCQAPRIPVYPALTVPEEAFC